MSDGKVRIIWEEKKGGQVRLYGGVDTTFSSILHILKFSGKSQNDFNSLIVDAKVKPHLTVPCILWCSGYEIGNIFQGLRDNGLCRDVPLNTSR